MSRSSTFFDPSTRLEYKLVVDAPYPMANEKLRVCPECGSPAKNVSLSQAGDHWQCSKDSCGALWGRMEWGTYQHGSAEVQQLLKR